MHSEMAIRKPINSVTKCDDGLSPKQNKLVAPTWGRVVSQTPAGRHGESPHKKESLYKEKIRKYKENIIGNETGR